MNSSFRVELEKETFIFSAAHFITFNKNICEAIHGHNYRVKCVVDGLLDENHYVIDFIALRDHLKSIVDRWDHHVLLPTRHKQISVNQQRRGDLNEVEVRFEDEETGSRRWVFPKQDCVLLDVENTTAELLAQLLAEELISFLETKFENLPRAIEVWVDENEGQWGICRLEL